MDRRLRLITLAVIACTLAVRTAAMTVYVPASQEMCFHETAYVILTLRRTYTVDIISLVDANIMMIAVQHDSQRGEKVVSSFNVASGGFLDIDIRVYGPDGKIVYEADREKDGGFQF